MPCSTAKKRTDSKPDRYLKVNDPILLAGLGGRQYCKEAGLTRELLLQYVLASQSAVPVKHVINITCSTLSGDEFRVQLEETDCSVKTLKDKIECITGFTRETQALFNLKARNRTSQSSSSCNLVCDASDELENYVPLASSCAVLVCLTTLPEWRWHSGSMLVREGFIDLCDRRKATLMTERDSLSFNTNGQEGLTLADGCNNLVTEQVFDSGTHTISFKWPSYVAMGLVPDELSCMENPLGDASQCLYLYW
jgi:hypothetical protein